MAGKMFTCKECGHQVSKRKSLYVESYGGRICRAHEEVFEKLEKEKLEKLAAERAEMEKKRIDELHETMKKIVRWMIYTAWVISQTREERFSEYVIRMITNWVPENRPDIKHLMMALSIPIVGEYESGEHDDCIFKETVEDRMHIISFSGMISVESHRAGPNYRIIDVYLAYMEKMLSHSELGSKKTYLLAQGFYEAMQHGELTDRDITQSLLMYGELQKRVKVNES